MYLDQVYRIHVTWEVMWIFHIVLKQDQKITFKETLSFMYDIWTNYTVDSRMYEEITKKGVTVYERDIAG